jgi:hypothetical protein
MHGPLGRPERLHVQLRITFVVAASMLQASCGDEVVYRHYPTHADAVAAGEQHRGWLPEWIPGTASDLHLESDLDSNEWWLRFSLPGPAHDSLKRQFEPADAASVRVSRPWRGQWWFEGLVQKDPANDAALNAELFRRCCDPLQRTVVLAFDRNTPTVYVWTQR